MPAKRLLRLLVLVQIPVAVAMGVASYLSMPSIPEELRSLAENKDALIPGATVLAGASALAFLIANVCLYVFWRGARILYLVITVVLRLMGLFLGPYVNTGWTDLFETTLTLLNGLILGLIYFSPAAELFQQPAGTNSIESATELPASPAAVPNPIPPFAPAAPATLFCESCGARGQGGKFCPQCGKPLVAGPAAAPGPSSGKGSARWPLMVGVVAAGLVLSLVTGYAVMRYLHEKSAEKAREDKAYSELQKKIDTSSDAFDRNFYEQRCGWGDAAACGKTAVMYWDGRGMPQDRVKALALHRKACDGGYAPSCEALKNLPESQIKPAANELFRQAGTMSVFGVKGKSIADSQGDATALFVRACDSGSLQGCAEAAARYRDGNGVARDYGRALELYRKACADGRGYGCEDMKEIPASK